VAGLRKIPGALRIRIAAHTDSIGSPQANLALSRRRAETVRKGLADRGLGAAEIEIAGLGEAEPIAPNSSEEGRQRNRRATLAIVAAVPMVPIRGQVKDPSTNTGIPDALVTFRSKTRLDSTRTDTSGYYSVRLPKDSVVKLEAVAPNYFFASATMRIFGSPELFKKYKLSPDISLPPAKAGEKAVIRDLFFVGNEAILIKASEPELPKVLRFMQINPALHIEIAGHVNEPNLSPKLMEDWKWQLSEDRAKTVYNYLVTNGISADRMHYKGYGNTEMIFPFPGATASQQQQNRRVEIRVVE
jgi:outer membrane protein OmpA-like peptidoglycan-associated protein